MPVTLPDPVPITNGGTITGLKVGLSLQTGDTISNIGNVTITPSTADLVVSNAAINTAELTINGRTYEAGQAVTYDLTYNGTVYGGAQREDITFAWTSAGGDTLTDAVVIELRRVLITNFSTIQAEITTTVAGETQVYTLTSTPGAALAPGTYLVDTSGGAVTCIPEETVGLWRFVDLNNTTSSDSLSVGDGTQTYNGSAGPLVWQGGGTLTVYNTGGSNVFSYQKGDPRDVEMFVSAEHDLGIVPNAAGEAANNTTKLQAYFTSNGTTSQPPLVFGVGDYYFSGQLHSGNDAGYRSFYMRGVSGPEFAAQHQEAGQTYQNRSRIMITGLTTSQAWLRITGSGTASLQPTSVRLEDLTFMIPHDSTGCILDLGDYSAAGSSDQALLRGITIRGCYFSEVDHVANDTESGNHSATEWLENAASEGYVLNRTQGDYLCRFTRCYDLLIESCGFRGSNGPQVWLANCDAPKIEKTHHIQAWQALRSAVPTAADYAEDTGVPGQFDVYCETPLISGAWISAGDFQGRIETGYSNEVKEDIGVLSTGPYSMPTGVTWSITPGNTYIQFAGLPGARTVADYFEPGMVVRLTPEAGGTFSVASTTSTTQFIISGGSTLDSAYVGRHISHANGTSVTATNTTHDREVLTYNGTTGEMTVSSAFSTVSATDLVVIPSDVEYNLIVIEVDAVTDRVYFAESDGVCKVAKRAVVGTAANCERIFGVPLVAAGERLAFGRMSLAKNESYPGIPLLALAPRKCSISVNGVYNGVGISGLNQDLTQWYLYCGHCTPQNFGQSKVLFQGHQGWSHPMVANIGDAQPYNPNISHYVRYRPESVYPLVWRPGMVTNDNAANQELTWHKITDGDEDVWCYYLGDQVWTLPFINHVQCNFVVRCYLPYDQTTTTWRPTIQDQTGTYQVDGSAGWNTLSFTTSTASPTFYRLSQRDYWVAWVGATPV